MRRVVSLFLPMWSTDRYRKNTGDAPPRDKPLVMATNQALVPELHVVEATPEADDEGLTRLATWCMRYSPLVAADRPNGVWLDVAGSAPRRRRGTFE